MKKYKVLRNFNICKCVLFKENTSIMITTAKSTFSNQINKLFFSIILKCTTICYRPVLCFVFKQKKKLKKCKAQ